MNLLDHRVTPLPVVFERIRREAEDHGVTVLHSEMVGLVPSRSTRGAGSRGATPPPKPDRKDKVPEGLNWNLWLGVASDRPYIGEGYYHPGNWRKRLDFGTGTFGDMGCHILDPVFGAIGVGNPSSIRSELPGPNNYNWSLDVQVKYVFPGSKFTTDPVSLTWYNGKARPPLTKAVADLIGSSPSSTGRGRS